MEIKNNNEIRSKQKIISKRNAGIDLIRIISMIGIVYTHVLFDGKGIYKYRRYKSKINNSNTYVFWHNNAFALISGIVGYKSFKYCNLLFLWLCVVFYSVGIHYYYIKFKKDAILDGKLYIEFFPVMYGRYWYFSSYFGMFIFLPAVNKGIQYLNKQEFQLLAMSIFGIFVFWYNFLNIKSDFFVINVGCSSFWLLCLYIIGAYIGKFKKKLTGTKRYIINFIYFFSFLFLCSIHNKYNNYKISDLSGKFKEKLLNSFKNLLTNKLNGITKTTQAILVTLFFLQLKYNKYLTKITTFFGHLTFGVYLIHINRIIAKNYIKELLNGQSDNLTFNEVIKMLILKSIKYFLECIIIEYLRHLLFIILRIRKICIFFEKIVFKISK